MIHAPDLALRNCFIGLGGILCRKGRLTMGKEISRLCVRADVRAGTGLVRLNRVVLGLFFSVSGGTGPFFISSIILEWRHESVWYFLFYYDWKVG